LEGHGISYLQHQYGNATDDPVVRRSRVELDGSVYCVILSTPQITQRFLRDPFNLFNNSGINISPPQYLYLLNSNGIPPTSFNNRFSTSPALDPSSLHQLDTLTSQYEAMATTIRSLSDDHKILSHNFQTAQDNITRAFADSTAVYATSNLVTAAQFELTSLQQSLTTLQLMLLMATNDQARLHIQDSINLLSDKIDLATETKNQRATELHALQSRTLPMLPSNQIPALIASSENIPMRDANVKPPTSSHKRMRTSVDDGEDARDAENVASQMQVDINSLP